MPEMQIQMQDAKDQVGKAEKNKRLEKKETTIAIDEMEAGKRDKKQTESNANEQSLTNADGKDMKPAQKLAKEPPPATNSSDNWEDLQKGGSLYVTAEDVVRAIMYIEENDKAEYKKLENIFEGRVRTAQPKCHTTAVSLVAHGIALTCQQLYSFHIIHRLPTIIVALLCGVLLQLIASKNAKKQRNSTEYANCMMFGLFWGCFSVMTMFPLFGIVQPSRVDYGVFFVAYTIYFVIYTVSTAPMNTVQFFFGLSMLLGLLLTDVNYFTNDGPVQVMEYAAAGYFFIASALSLYMLAHALLHSEGPLLSLPLGRSLIDVIELF
ncbi:Grp1 Fun34 YaaH domain containing protein [Trichuris trichiura]|uniref:Grp1 Fun34 YaaH domain containing protein n=1 Tax=Trichuris trichiura TaxID=36087 RepID=A0A077ZDF5_TRITR|nr:Grp1 Fun34 YaaH domain containing protein [Trichuris trichiura]